MASPTNSNGDVRMVRGDSVVPTPILNRGDQLLDDVYGNMMNSPDDQRAIHDSLDHLFSRLRDRQREWGADRWRAMVQRCREHPLRGLLHEDPFTCRAFNKPRGYAGDAVLLDYVYSCEERWPTPDSTRIGRHIFDYTTSAPASEGVRARRGFIADFIDDLANQKRRPEVLSIAAGHLRETEISSALKRQKFERFVALDSDENSLREIRTCYGHLGVETVQSRFRELISNRLTIGTFDCVYTTGLFDYLSRATGQHLVRTMFELLNPGGVLIVANFMHGIRDVGYMEAFMDWDLVYRSRAEMVELTTEIPERQIQDVRVFAEDWQNIIFMELTKK
ncbi:MAG: class I SAM-dependent methyltransferase [Pirellulaceae bacterium]|nr:class I SAM-dependent methyltransferase [Pirellulaceae bacterium]HJN12449.1 class I SAM-dependent methyltransferase [Pirellulaceae bacterium]